MKEMTLKTVKSAVTQDPIHWKACQPYFPLECIALAVVPAQGLTYNRGREEDQADDERSSLEDVTERQHEDEASRVPCLQKRRDLSRLLVRDAKIDGDLVQDRLAVV